MSYDFHLFLPQSGVDPLVTAKAEADEESKEINPGMPVPAKEARKRAIADALITANPGLEAFQCSFDNIAKRHGITVEEAKNRFRYIELNGPADGNGIQITLCDDSASLTVPYWHSGKKAEAVFSEIWDYLNIIQTIAGYQIYDAQLDRIIDLASDLENATNCYTNVAGKIG